MKFKTIYNVDLPDGTTEFFFDEKGKLLQYWDANDANYRHEYMNPLFKALGIKVECGSPRDPRWRDQIKKILTENYSVEDEDLPYLMGEE